MKRIFVISAIVLIGMIAIYFLQNQSRIGEHIDSTEVSFDDNKPGFWMFDGENWKVAGNPPECPEPFIINSPVDLDLVSGILYPGQLRGGDYKPHGGFRFDDLSSNEVEVRAVMDGYILKAARYEVDGEVQNLLFYVNECGMMVMHDHLLTLSPKLEEVYKNIIVGRGGDSRTTNVGSINIKKGEILATEVGFRNSANIFLDFGLYDLRKKNGINFDQEFIRNNPSINEYGMHALCWFDNLTSDEGVAVRALPAGGKEGKISDYCN